MHQIKSQTFQLTRSCTKTHDVINQSKLLLNYNMFKSDPALLRGLRAFGKGILDGNRISCFNMLNSYGKECGSEGMIETANLAEKNRPILRQFDTFGNRIDVVDFHPSYHKLMDSGKSVGVASYGYNNESSKPDAHITRAALLYMQNQVEPGVCCPLVMTNAAIPVLRRVPGCEEYVKKLCHQSYDPRNVPMEEKLGVTAGMSMTEKQGGSDVRANTTIAIPADETAQGEGNGYYLTGHKWFTSAPMCDFFLTLSQTKKHPSSPSCFLIPRWLPDGSRNCGFRVMRLKDKLADRSNASSEVEYDNAWGMMIGEEGKGVRTIIEMVQSTRLDCALGSAGLGRRALMEALYYTENRSAFGAPLNRQPLMQNLLADLCVEAEASTLMAMKMSSLFNHANMLDKDGYISKTVIEDENMTSEQASSLFRIGVAVTKYYVTKRLPQFVYECMEAHGGNGFIEDLPMAKLFRHSPLNSIWEGSGNVICLDVLRAHKLIPTFVAEIKQCSGIDSNVDSYIMHMEKFLYASCRDSNVMSSETQYAARHIVDQLAVAYQASLLLRYGCPKIAEMYIQSRIHPGSRNLTANYGSVPFSRSNIQHVLQENYPVFD